MIDLFCICAWIVKLIVFLSEIIIIFGYCILENVFRKKNNRFKNVL